MGMNGYWILRARPHRPTAAIHWVIPWLCLLLCIAPGGDIQAQDAGELERLERLAERSFIEDDLATAAALYRQLFDRQTRDDARVKTLMTIAWVEHLQKLDRDALQTLTRALVIDPNLPFDANLYDGSFRGLFLDAQRHAEEERAFQASELTREGLDHLRRREYSAARRHFEGALAIRHDLVGALYNLALTNLHDGRPDDAITGFQKVLSLAASGTNVSTEMRSLALVNLGYLYQQQNLHVEAEQVLERAVQLEADNAGAWSNLGVARRRLGKKSEAAEAFRRAYDLSPTDISAIDHVALAYLDAEDWAQAESILGPATAAHGDNPSLWLKRGLALAGLGDGDGAQAAFERSINLDPQDSAGQAHTAAVQLARHHYGRGDDGQALAAAQQALGWRPNLVNGWVYQGLAQKRLGDTQAALASLEKARRLDGTRAEIHNALGTLYVESNRPTEARRAFERALELEPGLTDAQTNLASLGASGTRRTAPPPPRTGRPPASRPSRPPPPAAEPPSLGIRFADVDYSALGLKGVLVDSVAANSPAARADLRAKDLLLKVDGRDILDVATLERYIASRARGATVAIDLLRSNVPKRIAVVLR